MSEITASLHAKKKKLNHYTGFDYFLIVFMGLLALITAFPFYYMLIVSFGTYEDIHAQSIYLWPIPINPLMRSWHSYRSLQTVRPEKPHSRHRVSIGLRHISAAMWTMQRHSAAWHLWITF